MRKSSVPQWGIRVVFYCIALFFMALGVAFSANSDLGISPVNSLPYVISDIVKMQPGTCVTIVFCSYILVQIILLRREFNPVNLFQIVFSTIFGYFVNFTISDGWPCSVSALYSSLLVSSSIWMWNWFPCPWRA